MKPLFFAALVAGLIGLQILGRAAYLALKEARASEFTPSGDPVRYTWRDFPQLFADQSQRLVAGSSVIGFAAVLFCFGLFIG